MSSNKHSFKPVVVTLNEENLTKFNSLKALGHAKDKEVVGKKLMYKAKPNDSNKKKGKRR